MSILVCDLMRFGKLCFQVVGSETPRLAGLSRPLCIAQCIIGDFAVVKRRFAALQPFGEFVFFPFSSRLVAN
jgi:hypothetical protein